MTALDAIILGLVEGITEYLPVSSTGHLIIAAALLGLGSAEGAGNPVNSFLIAIQGGAIAAVAGLYWRRVVSMLKGLAGRDAAGTRLVVNLFVAFLPAAVIGLLAEEQIETWLFRPLPVMGALAAGGVVMILLGRYEPREPREIDVLSWRRALVIGLAQCLAMWPGTSRSMVTIVAGMLVGLRPARAAEFSFLLGLPTLGAACAWKTLQLLRGGHEGALDSLGGPGPVILGFVVAAVSAAAAVRWLVGYLSRHGVGVFGWYRLVLCAVLGVLAWRGILSIGPASG